MDIGAMFGTRVPCSGTGGPVPIRWTGRSTCREATAGPPESPSTTYPIIGYVHALTPGLRPARNHGSGRDRVGCEVGADRITIIADLHDDVYDARFGRGGGDTTRMAGQDFGGAVLGRPVVVDALNDRNKPAEVAGLATQALDACADLLMNVRNSPIALAVSNVALERRKIMISTGAAIPALTRGACNRYLYHYSFDGPAIETATANYLASQPKAKRWVMVEVAPVFRTR
jgi:hypothetical protein